MVHGKGDAVTTIPYSYGVDTLKFNGSPLYSVGMFSHSIAMIARKFSDVEPGSQDHRITSSGSLGSLGCPWSSTHRPLSWPANRCFEG